MIMIDDDHIDNHDHCQEEPVGHHPPPHFLQPNPIDKLYLMQVIHDHDYHYDHHDDNQD